MRKLIIMVVVVSIFFYAENARSQDSLPKTAIYILSVKTSRGQIELGDPKKISDYNGYNNQPYFTPDESAVLYSSVRDGKHADVYEYSLLSGITSHPINTPLTSEFSPMLTPDQSAISCVRVMDDDSTQLLYKFSGSDRIPSPIFSKVTGVGYYCWINANSVAMFILGKPFTLQVGDIKNQTVKVAAKDVGRCLQKMPNRDACAFVQKNDTSSMIMMYNLANGGIAPVVKCLPASEDFCVMSDGTFLMGSGTKLFKYKPGTDKTWQQIADFSGTEVASFYRLSVSPKADWLAVVTYEGKKP
jgi:Tol biopolymer transport system component